MPWLRYFPRGRRDRDFALEIDAHLQHEIDENIARGMSPQEAAWAARRKFGNVTAAKENTHRMNTIGFLETLAQDLRYALRLFRLEPGFFTVAILCLALGIGANTAIFHLLDAVRLRTLPVPNPQELVEVKIGPNQHCCTGNTSTRRANFTYALWDQLRTHQQAFSEVFAWADHRFNTPAGGEVRVAISSKRSALCLPSAAYSPPATTAQVAAPPARCSAIHTGSAKMVPRHPRSVARSCWTASLSRSSASRRFLRRRSWPVVRCRDSSVCRAHHQ